MHEVAGVSGDDVGRAPGRDRAAADLGLPQGVRAARDDERRAAPHAHRPPGRGDHALPPGDRGDARPARPALHHQLPRAARPAARLPRGDGQRRARRAAPHRLRREAAVRPLPRRPRLPAGRRRPAARGDPLHGRRAGPARMGPPLHGGVRLHARGDRRRGRGLARDQAAQRRAPIEELPGPPIFSPGMDAHGARQARPAAGLRRRPGREDRAATTRPRHDAGALPDAAGGLDQRGAEPGTIQWDFADADPWHLVVANGDTRVEPGRLEAPTVTIQCRYEDWADLLGGASTRCARRAAAPAAEGRPALAVARRAMFPH